MTKEPKLKRGDRTAARVDEAEYPIGIGLVGYTPREGARYRYIRLKDIVYEEN